MMNRRTVLILVILLVCGAAFTASAQEQPLPVRTITDDEVNAIAKKLYCPVCENITLDTCGTAACDDWRYEIRLQLEQGRTEDQIVTDFVQRFGDRVVGTPQDAALRALSLVTPWVLIVGVLLILGWMLLNRRQVPASPFVGAQQAARPAQKYQDLIERDLKG